MTKKKQKAGGKPLNVGTKPEYGFNAKMRRRDRDSYWDNTTTSPNTAYVSTEESVIGLYRFIQPYALFDKPEQYMFTQQHHQLNEETPHAMTTGKVYLVNGATVAYQVMVTLHGHPKVCWTSSTVIAPVSL